MDKITQINDFFYLGSFLHCVENTDEFKKLKIDHVVNFAPEINIPNRSDMVITTFSIDKDFHPTLLDVLDESEVFIRSLIKNQKRIYLTCDDGNSRSPAVLIYYLMKKKNMTYIDAYELIEKKRPGIDLHPNFITELYEISESFNY